jgi:hypothetical protein
MTFKEQMAADMAVFFNVDEFADIHDINGYQVSAIIEKAGTKAFSNRQSEQYDGFYAGEVTVYVKAAALPVAPVRGQTLKLDGKLYYVVECVDEAGMLVIQMGANES